MSIFGHNRRPQRVREDHRKINIHDKNIFDFVFLFCENKSNVIAFVLSEENHKNFGVEYVYGYVTNNHYRRYIFDF